MKNACLIALTTASILVSTVAGAQDAASDRARLNGASVDALVTVIDEHYALRDTVDIEWDELLAPQREALIAAESQLDFGDLLAPLLATLGDRGLQLTAGGHRLKTAGFDGFRNYNVAYVDSKLPDMQYRSSYVVTGTLPEGIGYIRIGSFRPDHGPQVARSFAALREMVEAPALMIDVRADPGGSDASLAEKFAGCFIREPKIYGQIVEVDLEDPGGFREPVDLVVEPNPKQPHYAGPVAVLMGPINARSSELFLLMMRQAPNAVLVGNTSDGTGGAPKPHRLPNGVIVELASRRELSPDGTLLAGRGIDPDVTIDLPGSTYEKQDPVFDAAYELLVRRLESGK
jgi:hypothetical protein